MTIQTISINPATAASAAGSPNWNADPASSSVDNLDEAFDKCNDNFAELAASDLWSKKTVASFTDEDATPSVLGGSVFLTVGTTTITDFDDGVEGQIIHVLAETSITITDGTNIILHGSANFAMADSDSLTLICKADGKWYELARMVNMGA
jgi:hypothetical protein